MRSVLCLVVFYLTLGLVLWLGFKFFKVLILKVFVFNFMSSFKLGFRVKTFCDLIMVWFKLFFFSIFIPIFYFYLIFTRFRGFKVNYVKLSIRIDVLFT